MKQCVCVYVCVRGIIMKLKILRKIGYITTDDSVYLIKKIADFYNEAIKLHDKKIVDRAVDEFAEGYDPSKRVTSKLKFFEAAINRLIKNISKEKINEVSKFDYYRYWPYDLEFDLTLIGNKVKLTLKEWIEDRNKYNEHMLAKIKNKYDYSSEEINAIRQRWNELDRDELEGGDLNYES